MRVDLQSGFDNDVVEIFVNGAEALHEERVTSKRVLGFALSFEIEVPEGPLEIEVRVPTKKLSKTFSADASGTPNLGISIRDGELKIIKSKNRFGYA